MLVLPPRQQIFVKEYVGSGGLKANEAASKAGLGTDAKSSKEEAERLLKIPRILAAIREEADKRLKSGAVLAASVLLEIASNPMHRDQYKASVEILNRSGLIVENVNRVIVEDHRTEEEIVRRITDLSAKLGHFPA